MTPGCLRDRFFSYRHSPSRLHPAEGQQDAEKSDSQKFIPFGVNPWLAYVLVRQLCFIVADEDVRHAQV